MKTPPVIQVNGQPRQLIPECTVGEMLLEFKLAPIRVAVEVNRELVSRRDFDKTLLRDGDIVEIVTFVGGG